MNQSVEDDLYPQPIFVPIGLARHMRSALSAAAGHCEGERR